MIVPVPEENMLEAWRLSAQEAEKIDTLRKSSDPSTVGTAKLLHQLPDFETKIRPGAFELLNALKDRYRLFIYTMGDEIYACAMANLLDPDKGSGLFRNRIIDRSDSDWTQHQKGLHKLGVDPTLAAVVDDTPGERLRFQSVIASHAKGVSAVLAL